MSPGAAPKTLTVQATEVRDSAIAGSLHPPRRPHSVIVSVAVRNDTTSTETGRCRTAAA
jgi:hypothetical protein